MSLSHIDASNSLTSPLAYGPKRWLAPFPEITDRFIFEQDYLVLAASYSAPALNELHASEPGAFLVSEAAPMPFNNTSVLRLTRTYSRIPPSRIEYGSFDWYVPGIGSENPPGSLVNISASTFTAAGTQFTLDADPSVSVDDQVQVKYTVSTPTGQVGRTVLRAVVTVTTSTNITVGAISENYPVTWQTVQKVDPGRDPEARTVASELHIDYFLPGVSAGITSPSDIGIIDELEIWDSAGRKAKSFTDSTTPTRTAWAADIAAGTKVVVERSVVRRWLGNIYERSTRYARAL